MRRIIAVSAFVVILSTAGSIAAVGLDFGVAGGFQFKGDISDFDLDTDSGFSLGLELMFEIPIVKVGVGYEYGFPRDTDGSLSNIEYHLFYGIARVHFLGPVYAMGRAGYATMRADLLDASGSDDGLSWGLGIGFTVSRFKIEVAYNDFDITVNDLGGSVDYSNYAARLIYSF